MEPQMRRLMVGSFSIEEQVAHTLNDSLGCQVQRARNQRVPLVDVRTVGFVSLVDSSAWHAHEVVCEGMAGLLSDLGEPIRK